MRIIIFNKTKSLDTSFVIKDDVVDSIEVYLDVNKENKIDFTVSLVAKEGKHIKPVEIKCK